MKSLSYIFAITALLTTFQNCGNVNFTEAEVAAASKADQDSQNQPQVGPDMPDVVDDDGGNNLTDDDRKKYACKTEEGENGLKVCHYPPGNPEARHVICIGEPALDAHLHHGESVESWHVDNLGDCKD